MILLDVLLTLAQHFGEVFLLLYLLGDLVAEGLPSVALLVAAQLLVGAIQLGLEDLKDKMLAFYKRTNVNNGLVHGLLRERRFVTFTTYQHHHSKLLGTMF